MRFLYGNSFFSCIHNEHHIGHLFHVFDAAQILLKFFHLVHQFRNFLLGKNFKNAVFLHFFQLFQACDSGFDGVEVRQHTTEPSLVYIVHAASVRFFTDAFLCLLLCADKKDLTAVRDTFANFSIRIVNLFYCFLKVDDVDAIAFREDVFRHFGVPSSCLVSEMHTCFQ